MWEEITSDFWCRKTPATAGYVWPTIGGFYWVVYTRHQPGSQQRVVRIGRGENQSLKDAKAQADARIKMQAQNPGSLLVDLSSGVPR